MKVRENHNVIIERHPYAESLNKKLLVEVKKLKFYSKQESPHYTNLSGFKCPIPSSEVTVNMRLIVDWVENLLMDELRYDCPQDYHDGVEVVAKPYTNIWFAKYNKGDHAIIHDHKAHALYAFTYFLNSPSGSSPFVFTTSGKRIKPEEGKVVIFPGHLHHHVPKNKCDNRVVMAGNIGLVK